MVDFHKKCLFIFSVAFIVGLLVHLSLFWVNLGVPMEQERYLNEWLVKKDTYAASIKEPKIIFVSGSSTLFGIDTERIEHELTIPTVNFGVNASLFYYTLKRAQKHLQAGDIVILPLEYPYYTWHHDIFDPEPTCYYLGYDADEIRSLSLSGKMKFISQISTKSLLKFTCQRILTSNHIEGGYSSKYLNINGDMTNNHTDKKMSNSVLQSKINHSVFTEPPLTDDARHELATFINYCHDNNITVYAAWPSYLWKEKKFDGADLAGVNEIENFYRTMNVEILGSYTDCLYDIDMFYDTNYHLNEDGKRIHTDYIIDLLRKKMISNKSNTVLDS